ncbi:MAG: electron transfer flavoprotein subunit beta/FixA family protein [candidate division KSB1 bacterium]|nr:electron transfer flavoprotein subunit beta/FixA family protein [candidate division KSB1 bacterium]MDZ7276529.1 electron transfer flavoprotein subunit beta/FixA family protein [candidate division KSB1 bacterium]MDZ7286691.1 electron transfer flavoprotein subunit beta/FixA family protein [candidate division KSB1 bacterium]MDZ7300298.1 electron transfer flavoprotein subunit beta/FixA family protein [candidate division KSB1 bacterium]MDZ7351299.1 electron transfer flavoprotein subunit beta/FixA
MKIILCLKQVPLKDSLLKITADGRWIDETALQFEINESDHYGLEAALRLKEQHGGEVIVVSIGPARVKQAIQQALAKGADRAIHVLHDQPLMDPLLTARLLAAVIKPESPDLILTGLQSDDAGFGQTGVLLAELLGLPHASLVMEIQVIDQRLKIKRELESGWFQYIELPRPAVLTIQSGLAAIRYATIKGIMAAKKKPQQEISATSLGVDLTRSAVTFHRLAMPVKTKKTQILTGAAREVARELAAKLKNEAKVI